MDPGHVPMDENYTQMDGTIDRPPGSAPQDSSITRKRKCSTTNPRYQDTNSGSNSSSTPQQTLEAQIQAQQFPTKQLIIEFSFRKSSHSSMPAARFPEMPFKPAGGTAPGATVNTPSSVNNPSRSATSTPRGLIITTPASTATNNTLPDHGDSKFQKFKDTITAIPLHEVNTQVYLDLLSNYYNQIVKPPKARIYDVLWLHSYLFHHRHLLLELPAGKKTWRPVQFVWHASSLPGVPPFDIEDLCRRNLSHRTGFKKDEIVQGFPPTHNHGIVTSYRGNNVYGWCLDITWEVKLGVGIKGVGSNWQDVIPRACVMISDTEVRQHRGMTLGSKFRWFTEEEVRSGWRSGEGETLLRELVQMLLVAFVVRRQREEQYLGVY